MNNKFNIQHPIIKILAIGAKGCNILGRLQTSFSDNPYISCIAIAPTGKIFNQITADHKITLRTEKNLGLVDENSKSVTVQSIISEQKDLIAKATKGVDLVILLGNLCNETVVLELEAIMSFLDRKNTISMFFGSYPFSFEGKQKEQQARVAHKKLHQFVDATVIIENNKVLAKQLSAQEALTAVDKLTEQSIISIIEIVEICGLINVDFNDFKTTITDAGDTFFNTTIGTTTDIPLLITNLFKQTYLVTTAETMSRLVYIITAGPEISTEAIEQIGKGINEHVGDNSRIIFGVVTNETMGETVKITLIAGRGNRGV